MLRSIEIELDAIISCMVYYIKPNLSRFGQRGSLWSREHLLAPWLFPMDMNQGNAENVFHL